MKFKKALITGITGQDGSYLAEFLLKKNYLVHGVKRKSSSLNSARIDHIYESKRYKNRFFLHYGDLVDSNSIMKLINNIKPDEVYNFAAQSHVGVSFQLPNYTTSVNSLGTLNILQAIKDCGLSKKTKFYQPQNYLGKYKKKNNLRKQNFIPKVRMQHQNYLHIGLQKITGNLIVCLHLMEFYLIMNLQEEVKLLLQER